MTEAISKIIPIITLILIGVYARRQEWLDKVTVANVKKGLVSVALPAVLFNAFMTMDLKAEYLFLSVLFFVFMIVLLMVGQLLNKNKKLSHPALPFLMTGFAFGLLGIPMLGGVYGMENVGGLSVLGVGHEFFAWFVYVTVIKHQLGNEKFSVQTIKDFVKSPLIISIVAGLLINVIGLRPILEGFFLTSGLLNTITMLASITTPLILIIVGYGMSFETHYMKKSIQLLVFRLVFVFTLGYLLKMLLIDPLFHMNDLFDMSYYTFLILPPPFMLVIFIAQYDTEESAIVANNTIVLNTLFTIVAFSVGVVVEKLL